MEPHAHPHHHHHAPQSGRLLLLALTLTLLFALIEAVGGWWSGSLTLLGDAGHMLTDSVALGLSAWAAQLARRAPSAHHSYGLVRAEVVAALSNSVLMLLVVAGIGYEAVERLQSPTAVAGGAVMAVAGAGLAANLLVAYILSRGESNLNLRGALLHAIGDLLGSAAALAAGAVVHFTGWTPIDPLLALLVVLLILYSTLRLLRDSLHVVMEGVPSHLDLNEVGQAMARLYRVRSVHDLHIWTLTSGRVALTAHVVLEGLRDWPVVQPVLEELLHHRFGVDHITLQPETDTQVLHRLDVASGPPREPSP